MLDAAIEKIFSFINSDQSDEFEKFQNHKNQKLEDKIIEVMKKDFPQLSEDQQQRILDELFYEGPLKELLMDESITEILVNGPNKIWYEQKGQLKEYQDHFLTLTTYKNFIDRILKETQCSLTIEQPIIDTTYKQFRLNIVGHGICNEHSCISFRRHPENPWTFEALKNVGWCQDSQIEILKQILVNRSNFLIIGSTGSSKTSTINAFLQCIPANERVVVIEDSPEIRLPNTASSKLLTRHDAHGILKDIDQSALVKQSLRMRPDRVVMGEVRGSEAKDFLLAMATGHSGSFGTLHADHPHQALIRLEMLIQMGAPYWSLNAIRHLIYLSLQYIVVVGRESQGQRKLKGIYKINSLEEFGFVIERVDQPHESK